MKRIEHATALANANGSGKNGFFEGEKATQLPATSVTAKWLNDIQEEIANAITIAGLTLSDSRTQLSDAIAIAATGSSSANAISIQGVSVSPAAPAPDSVLIKAASTWTPGKLKDASIAADAAIALSKLSNSGASGEGGNRLTTVGGVPVWSKWMAYASIASDILSLSNANGSDVEAAPIIAIATGGTPRTVHGLKQTPGASPSFRIVLAFNGQITFPYNSGSVPAIDRIYSYTNSDTVIQQGQFVCFVGFNAGWYPLVGL